MVSERVSPIGPLLPHSTTMRAATSFLTAETQSFAKPSKSPNHQNHMFHMSPYLTWGEGHQVAHMLSHQSPRNKLKTIAPTVYQSSTTNNDNQTADKTISPTNQWSNTQQSNSIVGKAGHDLVNLSFFLPLSFISHRIPSVSLSFQCRFVSMSPCIFFIA